MNRHIYSILLIILKPFVFIYFTLIKSRKNEAYKLRLDERFSSFRYPKLKEESSILFHCASVGETIAAKDIINHIVNSSKNKNVIVTSTTPTGSEQVRKLFGDRVSHFYLPFDTPSTVKNFITSLNIDVAFFMETELWPNLIHFLKKRNAKIILVNARLSNKSYKGYKKVGKLTSLMLQSLDCVLAQDENDKQRFISLGINENKVHVVGNVKYSNLTNNNDLYSAHQLRTLIIKNHENIIIAGSTHDGEDEIIISAFHEIKSKYNNSLLILAPRHQNRMDKIEKALAKHQLNYSYRSTSDLPKKNDDVYIIDTIGELSWLYGVADVAFVGGSMIPHGGQNPLEPARVGTPIIMGKSNFNFSSICNTMIKSGAMLIVNNGDDLKKHIFHLLQNKETSSAMVEKASFIIKKNKYAIEKTKRFIDSFI